MTGPRHKPPEPAALLYFIIMVICERQCFCLIDENLPVEPTVSEHLTPSASESTSNASLLNCTSSSSCASDGATCLYLCHICEDFFPGRRMDCLSLLLETSCLSTFRAAMADSGADACLWGHVSGFYSNLSLCTEEISDCLCIPWPNPLVEQKILDVHSQYFLDCPSEELNDPPPVIVFALVITPICLIPLMVSLVVLKTKNGDGSS